MGRKYTKILMYLDGFYPEGARVYSIENALVEENKCPGILRSILTDGVIDGYLEIDNTGRHVIYRITLIGMKYINQLERGHDG